MKGWLFIFLLIACAGCGMNREVSKSTSDEHCSLDWDSCWHIRHSVTSRAMDATHQTLIIKIVDSAAFVREKIVDVADENILQPMFFTSSGISFDVMPDYKVRGKVKLVSWVGSELVVSCQLRFIPVKSLSGLYTLKGKYRYLNL